MTINLQAPHIRELKPRITVFGIGGGGGNAVNNMIEAGLQGVEFVVANTDAQALSLSRAERRIQMGLQATQGLGAGSQPEIGRAAAEEVIDEIRDQLAGANMIFVTAGMGGGTGTGAAPVIARIAREMGILTVGVVTKPFQFEGVGRMRKADAGILELQKSVDTLIVIPNQNLFRITNQKTGFAEAFAMADQVLYSGVASITDLMVKPGLINLDFADVRTVMRDMGKAMMGTGEASGEKRAIQAAEAAIANPLLDETSMKGAKGLLVSITGGKDMTLYELDEAANRIRDEVDPDANIIVGATEDESLEGIIRVSVVATGIDKGIAEIAAQEAEAVQRVRPAARHNPVQPVAPAAEPLRAAELIAAPAYKEPVQTAQSAYNGVTMRTVEPQLIELPPAAHVTVPVTQPAAAHEAFIPPMAERTQIRQARMPRVDELPAPAQAQIRAAAELRDGMPPHAAESKRMTLLQRLAAVGLGRKDEGAAAPVVPALAPLPAANHADYARRPAVQAPRPVQAALDTLGRTQPKARPNDDDQLEIPAFLRRQAN